MGSSGVGTIRFGLLVGAAMLAAPMSASGFPQEKDDSLRERLKDQNAAGTDLWIYNDLAQARSEARRQNKPLFVTFRCVPCRDCAAFDAEVAKGSERIDQLAREHFVAVRQVEMKGVDLTQFQFDYDLNWAAMFINADGTVYARYGTQSAKGPDAYNSIEGLENTMRRVLALHAEYPKNAAALREKRGPQRPFSTALEMPGLENPAKYRQTTTRENCIHCHNIHDAEQRHAQQQGTFSTDMLWRYPLPDNIGLSIDSRSGIRIAGVEKDSPAAKAGLRAGEDVVSMNGQPITSIADMQWVLHQLPHAQARVEIVGSQSGRRSVILPAGWKKSDISWRGSMWSLSPRFSVWTPELTAGEKRERGIAADQTALLVKWINTGAPGGRAARDAGLQQGDVIVALAGKPLNMSPQEFNVHIKLNYKVGDRLPLTVLRGDRRQEIVVPLVE